MSTYLEKTTNYSFEKAIVRVKEALKSENFSVLTEANLHDTFKEKFDINFRNYKRITAENAKSA